MATITWTPPDTWEERTGAHVTFTAPCDCADATALVIGENSYSIVDATQAVVTGTANNVFATGAIVELILDCENMMAYIINGAGGGGDAIVAQGTSGSWYYTKWESGLAECFCSVTSGAFYTSPSALGYLYEGYSTVSFPSYPFTFVEAPAVCVGRADVGKWDSGTDMILSLSAGTAYSPPYVRLLRPTAPDNAVSDPVFTIFVKGRWQ